MIGRNEPRISKRMPCSITVTGRRHAGLVLNVSPRGLFVQTNAKAAPGEPVSIALCAPTHAGAIELHATVVWKHAVPHQLMSVAKGGVGVRIESAAETFYEYLSTVLPSMPAA